MSKHPRRTITAAAVAAIMAGTLLSATPALAWSSATEAHAMSVAADPAGQPYVVDSFSRTATGSWGAGQLGTWTTGGDVARAAVTTGQATLTLPTTGGNATSVAAATATDTDLQTRIGLAKLPAADSVDLYVVGRALDATSGYRTKLKVLPDGNVAVSLLRVNGASAKTIATAAGTERLASGGQLQVRMQTVGTGTTQVRTKVWPVGQAEPAAWDAEASDTTAALQAPGGVGFTVFARPEAGTQIAATVSDVWAGPTSAARTLDRVTPAAGSHVPDATTTGVPTGTPLTVREGDLTITQAGTVIDGMDVRGFITVKAKNVTIRNTVVRGRPTTTARGLVTVEKTGGLTIEDSEIYAANPSWFVDGLRAGGSLTARRLNIHDVIDTMHLYGELPVVLESSWLHDTLHYEDDPAHSDGSHDDNIQIVKSTDVTIKGNRIEGAYNAAIMITQGVGPASGIKITNNVIGGGSCSVNIAEKGKGALSGLVIKDNTFLLERRKPGCMVIAPMTTQNVSTITGNVMEDGSKFATKKG